MADKNECMKYLQFYLTLKSQDKDTFAEYVLRKMEKEHNLEPLCIDAECFRDPTLENPFEKKDESESDEKEKEKEPHINLILADEYETEDNSIRIWKIQKTEK